MPDILLADTILHGYPPTVLRRIKDQRLVIVEDNDSIRNSLNDYFGEQNQVIAFASAEEALAAESTLSEVHVFIIDYKLPEMNGAELFARLRGNFPQAKFILITGEMNYEVAENNRQLGWDALILKPFDFGILEDNIFVLVAAPVA
jgi:two-component system, response regulator RegA